MQNTISEQFRWYSKRYKRKGYDLVMQTSLNLSILELLDDLKNYLGMFAIMLACMPEALLTGVIWERYLGMSS